MTSLEQLQAIFDKAIAHDGEYRCRVNLNLFDSPSCTCLATQAASGRHLQIVSRALVDNALEVRLCEDEYSAWLPLQDIVELEPATTPYQAIALSPEQIQERLPAVIAFTKAAMQQPNYYLWGGTVEPNYDCSGLMQAAFAASGIWLPRDSYQQEAFTQRIDFEQLIPGDLVFFAKDQRVNHVGLYLGDGYYIHSSGNSTGRNGIAIDRLSEEGDEIAKAYYRQLKSVGRVVESYQPAKYHGTDTGSEAGVL
ncbi:MAG: C40 family peptidase [Coleofasciculus sp. Co-bin14]|nr:C40 family peptidase [Coleofasciculus sp. Co-bin14]